MKNMKNMKNNNDEVERSLDEINDLEKNALSAHSETTITTTKEKVKEKYKSFVNNFGSIVFVMWMTCLIFSCINLIHGSEAQGAKADDFVSIGKRCEIESIQYETHTTTLRGKEGMRFYTCDESWQYEFVVLSLGEEEKEEESFSSATTVKNNTNNFVVFEENLACGNLPCNKCPNKLGRYALMNDEDYYLSSSLSDKKEGSFVTECWSHKKKDDVVNVDRHPFWQIHCSSSDKLSLDEEENEECYLLSNPQDILNEYHNRVFIGWMLFIPVVGLLVVRLLLFLYLS